jgi:hypothetical protein
MPTSSRPGSSRTKKAPATAEQSPAPPRANSSAGEDAAESTEVTAANLERREIPSFSISREARIAEAAYWRAERRGFTAGQELDDWLAAEREIDGELDGERTRRE